MNYLMLGNVYVIVIMNQYGMETKCIQNDVLTFKINRIKYSIHSFVLREMTIFNDFINNKKEELELEWPISNNFVDIIFFVCMNMILII
jgi:hypothetical protein